MAKKVVTVPAGKKTVENSHTMAKKVVVAVRSKVKEQVVEDDEEGDEEEDGDDDDDDEGESDEEMDDEDDNDDDDDEDEDDSEEMEMDAEDDDDDEGETEEEEPVASSSSSSHEDVIDDLNYDVRNLATFNYHPIRLQGNSAADEAIILEAATRATQLLVKRIFACPIERSEIGPLAVLPTNETMLIPREKRIPETKQETKWDRFAKDKGIKKRKRDRMVFDETSKEYKPRFGYKGVNSGVSDQVIVEVKHGQDPYADPWAEDRKEKKGRVEKNAKNQQKNLDRANGWGKPAKGKKGETGGFDPSKLPGIPLDLTSSSASSSSSSSSKSPKRGKEGVRRALQLVQHSTASMGRFDEMRPGEPLRKMQGKKRTFRDNINDMPNDQKFMKDQLRIVADKVDKKKRGVTNSLAAYEGIIPDAPTEAFVQRKGKGKAAVSKERRAASRVGKPRAGTVKSGRAGAMKKVKGGGKARKG